MMKANLMNLLVAMFLYLCAFGKEWYMFLNKHEAGQRERIELREQALWQELLDTSLNDTTSYPYMLKKYNKGHFVP